MYYNENCTPLDIYTQCDTFGEMTNIAILERWRKRDGKKDYIVAWNYNSNENTWSQGYYDFKDRAEAQKFIFDRYWQYGKLKSV